MAESKPEVPDIHPVLAEHVRTSDPPPSYAEVMGQFVTSVTETKEEELPALSYIDIMPRLVDAGDMNNKIAPKFEKFSDIMRGANLWLRNNPGLRVWKCETVERKVDLGPVVHLDTTVHHESSYGANYYVFGVRLWLTKRLDPADPVQELALLNVPPPIKEIPVAMATKGFGLMGMGMGMSMGMGMGMMPVMVGFGRRGRTRVYAQGVFTTYENLSKAVESYNEGTQEDPLPGSILNVETTSVKFGDSFSGKEADPDVTSWSETGKSSGSFCTRRFTKILRIFYVKGPPKLEKLSMLSFLPRVTKQPEWNRSPQFEPFDAVLTRSQQWLQTQSGIRVVSIETSHAKFTHGFGQPVSIEDESTDDFVTSLKEQHLVRFLRVFYVTAPEMTSYQATVLTSRLFVPAGLGGRRFETMAQTLARVNAWLGIVGQRMFSVETVPFLLSVANTVTTDRSDFKHCPTVGNYWLTCVRLYFPQPFQEPPADLLPPAPKPGSNSSSSCVIV
ncbi:uncharacterized protein LOC143289546 [Babylonia areolata]|uniref:uncharacterized protein LOC143289546 n=1 Tax=Babylonia areolata TaxID=304850 RepID=UPI003FD2CEE7